MSDSDNQTATDEPKIQELSERDKLKAMPNEKLIFIPENFEKVVKIPCKGLILKKTMKYCKSKTESGLILPPGADGAQDFEKKYGIGEVVVAGPDCEISNVGDVVVYQKMNAFRIPDGENPGGDQYPNYVRIDETTAHVICVLPGDVEQGE